MILCIFLFITVFTQISPQTSSKTTTGFKIWKETTSETPRKEQTANKSTNEFQFWEETSARPTDKQTAENSTYRVQYGVKTPNRTSSTTSNQSIYLLTTPSVRNGNTNVTEEQAISEPIMLTITPNASVFEGNGNLTCTASGINLQKIQPYELVWFGQGVGGTNNEILKKYNLTVAVLDHSTLERYAGQSIFCALIFNYFSPKHHWTMTTKYVLIAYTVRGINVSTKDPVIGKTGKHVTNQERKKSNSSKVIVASVTGIACVIVLIIASVLLYRRFRKKARTPPPVSEDKPSEALSQENIYTYIPLQPIPFEEARSMLAANLKSKPVAVKPPPLPARPHYHRSLSEEEEYIYSYTYGVKK